MRRPGASLPWSVEQRAQVLEVRAQARDLLADVEALGQHRYLVRQTRGIDGRGGGGERRPAAPRGAGRRGREPRRPARRSSRPGRAGWPGGHADRPGSRRLLLGAHRQEAVERGGQRGASSGQPVAGSSAAGPVRLALRNSPTVAKSTGLPSPSSRRSPSRAPWICRTRARSTPAPGPVTLSSLTLMATEPRVSRARTMRSISVSISGASRRSCARTFTSRPRWLSERTSTLTVRAPRAALARPKPVMLMTFWVMKPRPAGRVEGGVSSPHFPSGRVLSGGGAGWRPRAVRPVIRCRRSRSATPVRRFRETVGRAARLRSVHRG